MCPDLAPTYDHTLGQYECPSEQNISFDQREGIQAFRRVLLRESTPPPLNTSPGIALVNINGIDPMTATPIVVARCARASDGTAQCPGIPLVIFGAPTSAESYTDSDGGTEVESLLASFFVTAGSTDHPRALPSSSHPDGSDGALRATWYPPPDPGAVRIWFTLRDGRGGDSAVGPFSVTVM
jgi:hypothetical protein